MKTTCYTMISNETLHCVNKQAAKPQLTVGERSAKRLADETLYLVLQKIGFGCKCV